MFRLRTSKSYAASSKASATDWRNWSSPILNAAPLARSHARRAAGSERLAAIPRGTARPRREYPAARRDFRLDAFIGRLSQFDGSDESVEGIASLAANKPPRDWVDPDLDQAAIELADMAQKFLRAETYARVKGRPDKRQAMAVVIGIDGRPAPLLEEFDIADSDRATVNDLIERVTITLEQSDISRGSIILAALAELSTRYMQKAPPAQRNGKDRAAS